MREVYGLTLIRVFSLVRDIQPLLGPGRGVAGSAPHLGRVVQNDADLVGFDAWSQAAMPGRR